ncbi:MAG: hypothetical protein E6Q66_06785 [Pedobacter sp.]|nr:MAG: hypothetical protein E6Q66_06785 [Pedobacter sp.]
MINTEAVDSMLEELHRSQKKISLLESNLSRLESAHTNSDYPEDAVDILANKLIETLQQLLEKEKVAARFIHDLLALEYEHLEVDPILKQIQTHKSN